ncbi:MAG: LysM peptidoglycan-binding domain-containing protein, partial [Elusimicrobiota bacterium]|nr:LysM peptidoglycan-binding domain-containing protein [Elusimicrobiota bacterium]
MSEKNMSGKKLLLFFFILILYSSICYSEVNTVRNKSSEATDPPKAGTSNVVKYIVKEGDSLWEIARVKLGNPLLWKSIGDTYNSKNPEKPIRIKKITEDLTVAYIYPGQILIIPDLVPETLAMPEEPEVLPSALLPSEPVVPEPVPSELLPPPSRLSVPSDKLDLNQVTLDELLALGLDELCAKNIIRFRTRVGFK